MSEFGARLILSESIQELDKLHDLPKQSFASEVGEASLKPDYLLILDPKHLIYSVRMPEGRNYDPFLALGQFKANLWTHDVSEIFIGDDGKNSYQEFNIAPSGAYWTSGFSEYRSQIPVTEQDLPGVRVLVALDEANHSRFTSVSIAIPRAQFKGCSFTERSRISCSAIVGAQPRNYFSTSKLNAEKPDFHDANTWGRVKIVAKI